MQMLQSSRSGRGWMLDCELMLMMSAVKIPAAATPCTQKRSESASDALPRLSPCVCMPVCARVLARASVSSRGEGVACECVEGKSQSVSEKQRSTTSEEPDSTSVARTFMLWLVRLFYPAFCATKPWIIPKVQILFSNHKQG
ncbi:hypothetical protein H1C71_041403 [Ictidomys tridecemlineatus]|nr:hypothetical protein H1C71_041403 [Ictidomys tridecemlineatus]